MKKIITLLLLAFVLTSGTFAQVRFGEVGTSKSKTVQFMETAGSFLKKETVIKLPIAQNGEPDWAYIENYIKELDYSNVL